MEVRVVVRDSADPRWRAGAPVPVLVASEDRTLFAAEQTDGRARVAEFGMRCRALRLP
jgi:hypothetical protein